MSCLVFSSLLLSIVLSSLVFSYQWKGLDCLALSSRAFSCLLLSIVLPCLIFSYLLSSVFSRLLSCVALACFYLALFCMCSLGLPIFVSKLSCLFFCRMTLTTANCVACLSTGLLTRQRTKSTTRKRSTNFSSTTFWIKRPLRTSRLWPSPKSPC